MMKRMKFVYSLSMQQWSQCSNAIHSIFSFRDLPLHPAFGRQALRLCTSAPLRPWNFTTLKLRNFATKKNYRPVKVLGIRPFLIDSDLNLRPTIRSFISPISKTLSMSKLVSMPISSIITTMSSVDTNPTKFGSL